MKRLVLSLISIMVFIGLSGCATNTVVVPYKNDIKKSLKISLLKDSNVTISKQVLTSINEQVKNGLIKRNLLYSNETDFNNVEIRLTSYRMRPDAARLTVGILAGCDNIKSDIIIKNNENIIIGQSKIEFKECAAWGVSSQVITAYSKEVIKYLTQ
ncbi:MAG: hypothetical protein Q9M43_16125 [Sulfurimonas sp.]|nr:hypothetical protein [Sulfurimonas sp.]